MIMLFMMEFELLYCPMCGKKIKWERGEDETK
jgi:endogenous inhibitor of DNA gyrase (YacG/DUF329 family)